MNTPTKIALTGGAVAVVVVTSLFFWQAYGSSGDEYAFRTAGIEKGDLAATIAATGTIEPEEVIDIGAQVAAQIKNFGANPDDPTRSIDYGTIVHPGTLLAQLDDSLFKARVQQAQAAVDEAEATVAQADAGVKRAEADLVQYKAKLTQSERDWTRAQELRQSRTIADIEYDLARATLETARANVNVADAAILQAKATKLQAERSLGRVQATKQEAEVNLGYTQIRSPVEGVIIDRRVNVGQTVVAGLNAPSLFLIAKDLKRMQVWASVNEADIGNIHAGQNVRFTVDTYPRETFVGKVAQVRLNANMTQSVVTYTVVVSTDNTDGRLYPYMTANMQFEVAYRKDALLIPNAALRWKPRPTQIAPEDRNFKPEKEGHDRAIVYRPEGRFVRPVSIQTGLTDGVQTEILSGDLKAGDTIVLGARRLNKTDDAANPFAPKMFVPGKKG